MSSIFDVTTSMLAQGLDITLRRQNVLTSNIANLDTPGFQPRDVDFQAALGRAMEAARSGDKAALGADQVALIERPDRTPGIDGNAVDLDVQMSRISHNSMFYGSLTQSVSRKFAMLRYAINEGGA